MRDRDATTFVYSLIALPNMSENPQKLYIDARTLLINSVKLARLVWADEFRPSCLVSIWRGGTPPGIAIQEFFRVCGHKPHHTVIRAQSYEGTRRGKGGVEINGLGDVIATIKPDDRLLIIDDVFDTGHTMVAILEGIMAGVGPKAPECRVATVYYKPKNNETALEPNYYTVADSRWIVFPHEIMGLTDDELRRRRTQLYEAALAD